MSKRPFYIYVRVLMAICLALAGCAQVATPAPTAQPAAEVETSPGLVAAEGILRPAAAVELAFPQGGVVAEVLVQPGAAVLAGEALIRLVGREAAQAELAAAELEQILAQQTLQVLQRNALLTDAEARQALLAAQSAFEAAAEGWQLPDEDEASELELALDDYLQVEQDHRAARQKLDDLAGREQTDSRRLNAQEDLDAEAKNLDRAYTELLDEMPSAGDSLDADQVALLQAIATLELTRQQLARLAPQTSTAGIDAEVLAAAEARLQAAEAHRQAAEAALAAYELRAPFAGRVFSLEVEAGESVLPGAAMVFLADASRWIVETTDLAEIDIAQVALGQVAAVKLDAFSGETFSGRVTAIDPVGKLYLGDMTYQVTVTLDEAEARFLWNMTATVSIELSE